MVSMYNKFNVGYDDIAGHLSHESFESSSLFCCSYFCTPCG